MWPVRSPTLPVKLCLQLLLHKAACEQCQCWPVTCLTAWLQRTTSTGRRQ